MQNLSMAGVTAPPSWRRLRHCVWCTSRRASQKKAAVRASRPQTILVAAAAVLAAAGTTRADTAPSYKSTDIIVLGDSQLSFGAGPVLKSFFEDLAGNCAAGGARDSHQTVLANARYSMLGVRSTSLQSWVSRKTPAWRQLCRKDKTHGVNASVWGTMRMGRQRFVQVGEGRKFQFCKPDRTPLQAMLAADYYMPRVVMFFVGGNGAGRLAGSASKTQQDVDRLIKQLPGDVGCLFMTTVPVYTRRLNRARLKAQKHLGEAFAKHGDRCTFVAGFTDATVSAIQGKSRYFRRRRSGRVKDPFHPDKRATSRFLSLRRQALCSALRQQISRSSSHRTKAGKQRDNAPIPPHTVAAARQPNP